MDLIINFKRVTERDYLTGGDSPAFLLSTYRKINLLNFKNQIGSNRGILLFSIGNRVVQECIIKGLNVLKLLCEGKGFF